MIVYKIRSIVILLVTLSLDVSTHHDIELNKLTKKEGHAINYFAKILNSIIKLNEERVGNIKKLYRLNNYDFGTEPLRTFVNNADDYDHLIKNIKIILKVLNNNEHDLPNNVLNLYRTRSLNRNTKKSYFNRILRQLEDSNSNDISDNRQKNDKDENISEDFSSDIEGNTKNESLRYYYYYYICDDSLARCKKSCKAAYRDVCYDLGCSDNFRREMKKSCRKSCEKWFDD